MLSLMIIIAICLIVVAAECVLIYIVMARYMHRRMERAVRDFDITDLFKNTGSK